MVFEQLDAQDKEICEALKRGVAPEEVKTQFGIDDAKISQLLPVVEEMGGVNTEAKESAETVEEAKSTTDQATSTEETA